MIFSRFFKDCDQDCETCKTVEVNNYLISTGRNKILIKKDKQFAIITFKDNEMLVETNIKTSVKEI